MNDRISHRQAVMVLLGFIFGSSVVMGVSFNAGRDDWVSSLLAIVMMLPLALLYGRLLNLFPGENFFSVCELVYGKGWGKIPIALFSFYALHLGAMVMCNFSQFVGIVSMPETPQLALLTLMAVIVILLSRGGVRTLARWSVCSVAVVLLILLLTLLLALSRVDIDHYLPLFTTSPLQVLRGSWDLVMFPLAETVLCLALFGSLKGKASTRVFLIGYILGGIMLTFIVLRNLGLLGLPLLDASLFPSYSAARVVSIGTFLSRIESSISINFILAGITKITVCLLVASRGASHLAGVKGNTTLTVPTGLLMLGISTILYENSAQMFDFLQYYHPVGIFFEILLPAFLWVCAEWKAKKLRNAGKTANLSE